MKKLFLAVSIAATATSAIAADLPSRKEPVVAPSAPAMWTGFYVGLNAGGTWANNSASSSTWNLYGDPSSNGFVANSILTSAALLTNSYLSANNSAEFIGGGQMGYNIQVLKTPFGPELVLGFETDIQATTNSSGPASHLRGALSEYAGSQVSILSNQQTGGNLQFLGTVRGRIGALVTPTILAYATGGLSYGGVSGSAQNTQYYMDMGNNHVFDAMISGNVSATNTLVGWAAGGGLEWMFLPNWSAKAEYLFYDLGAQNNSNLNTYMSPNVRESGVISITNYNTRWSGNIVRAGVNYHFNFGTAPVIAKSDQNYKL